MATKRKTSKKKVDGGDDPKKPKATTQDSLDVYNNALKVINYYNNQKYNIGGQSQKLRPNFDEANTRAYKRLLSMNVDVTTDKGDVKPTKLDYRKEIDDNKYYQRELANFIVDTRSPMQLFDKRIVPTKLVTAINHDENDKLYGDAVTMYSYDPILTKPVHLLTPSERLLRAKKEKELGIKSTLQNVKDSPQDNNNVDPRHNDPNYILRRYNDGDPNSEGELRFERKPPRPQVKVTQAPLADINLSYNRENVVQKGQPYFTPSKYKEGVLKQDFTGVPNIEVWSKRGVNDNILRPVALVNQAGEAIDYQKYKDAKFPEGFQHPQKLNEGGMVDPNSNFLWDMLSGKIPKQAFNNFKTEYAARQKQTIANPLPMAPNAGPYGDMARGMWGAQEQLKQYSPEDLQKGKDYKYETPKIDDSNILYKLPQFEQDQPKANPLSGIMTGLGSLGMTMSNTGKPDALGGALSGAAMGAGYGGPLGAVIGGLVGFAGTGLNRTRYEEAKTAKEKEKIRAATVYGTDIGQMAEGGFPDPVGGEEGELTPVQMERGERIASPDGHIYKTKAKKTHKQMKDDEVTDILPPDVWVASAAKKMMISRKKAEQVNLGFDTITYDEEGNSSAPKENKLSDYFKREKMTPAELLGVIENKFPTNNIEYDPFARRARVLNLRSRIPLINAVIEASQK